MSVLRALVVGGAAVKLGAYLGQGRAVLKIFGARAGLASLLETPIMAKVMIYFHFFLDPFPWDEYSSGDQTIILGLQILLDYRSSRTINQKLPAPQCSPPLSSSEFIGG